jgi:hypothetical protein
LGVLLKQVNESEKENILCKHDIFC